ncbi:MAG: CDP-alcohol phosphatidyltransferase family protein [Gemmatimonadota bacterium]|nr:CDP-alcohol phosphatidyltransferase family protein [Gemmatimonadota bacterium]
MTRVLDTLLSDEPPLEAEIELMSTTTTKRDDVPPLRTVQLPPAQARDVWGDLLLGGVPLAAVSGATCRILALPTSYLFETVALYVVMVSLIVLNYPGLSRGPGIGVANRVTLWRATIVLPVTTLLLRPEALRQGAQWWIIALATAALTLDGVDGRIARRTGTSSAFGARFDMEVDALLLVTLAALLWQSGKVPVWVLAIGGLRYAFVAAGRIWPVLAAELRPSQRRRGVCVVQGVALLIALVPIVSAHLATLLTGAALILLTWSFAIDVVWLLTHAGHQRAGAA